MADKRKSISGSVLRKDEKHWCSAITKYKEKSCSYTHIILLFLLQFITLLFSHDTAGVGENDRSMSDESHLMANNTFIPIEIH